MVIICNIIDTHAQYVRISSPLVFVLTSVRKFPSGSDNMHLVMLNTLKQVVVRSREEYTKLILWKLYFAYSYCIEFELSYLGDKIVKNTIKSYHLAALI